MNEEDIVRQAASINGKKSWEAKKKKLGKRKSKEQLREWGKKGGRPKKTD